MNFIRNLERVFPRVTLLMVLVAVYPRGLVPAEAADGTKFPIKPITILNSSPAGSPADVMARQIAQHAKKHLSQPMVIVNKPGAAEGLCLRL